MPVRARIILGPDGVAFGPRAAGITVTTAAPVAAAGGRGIHKPRESPLGFLQRVRRQGDVAQPVLHTRILPKRQLEGVEDAEQGDAGSQSNGFMESHALTPIVRISLCGGERCGTLFSCKMSLNWALDSHAR